MASDATGVSGLAERYAKALFELADERKQLDEVAADLRGLRALLAESADLRRLLRSPVLTRLEQGRAISAIAERAEFSMLTRNFLGVTARSRRLFVVPQVIEAYLAQLADRRGEVTARITTASRLSQSQIDALNEHLRKSVGRKVALDIWIDPALIGGIIVKVGSRMVDASLKSKLARLQLAMKGVQ